MRLLFLVILLLERVILFTMIIRYLGYCKICFDSVWQVSPPQQEQVLYKFCFCSCINNSCMEVESVGVTYNRQVVSKAGDFTVHMSCIMYFLKIIIHPSYVYHTHPSHTHHTSTSMKHPSHIHRSWRPITTQPSHIHQTLNPHNRYTLETSI